MEPLTKKDLLDALKPLAKADDLANVEQKLDHITERVNEIPTRGELGELFKKFYDGAVINTRLERLEKHLGLEAIHVE